MGDIIGGQEFTMNSTEAATIIERLESGEALRTIIGGFGRTPICSRKAFFRHCELHPEWGRRALALANARSKSRVLDGCKKRVAARTHCSRGHELTPENTTLVIVKRNGWRHRECKICRAQWNLRGRYTREQLAKVVDIVKGGGTLTDATKGKGAIIKCVGLQTAFRDNPALEAELRPLSQLHARAKLKLAWGNWRSTRPPSIIRPRSGRISIVSREPTLTGVLAAQPHIVFTTIDEVVPKTLEFERRREVVSEMMLAVLEGRLQLENAKAAYPSFLTVSYRMFAHRTYGDIRTPISLDAPAHLDSKTPLVELLSERALWE
ncbi:hypothetical protein AAFG07_20910 [Bradyrhizobium sp. B097]|uniref:hypothetical protein n=1 Tax=Bradyrhizobium sp. B097 TaxID=3140244 RepID=UPI003183A965